MRAPMALIADEQVAVALQVRAVPPHGVVGDGAGLEDGAELEVLHSPQWPLNGWCSVEPPQWVVLGNVPLMCDAH